MFKVKEGYNREWLEHYGFQKTKNGYEIIWPYVEVSLRDDSELFQITAYSRDDVFAEVDDLLILIYNLAKDGVIEIG